MAKGAVATADGAGEAAESPEHIHQTPGAHAVTRDTTPDPRSGLSKRCLQANEIRYDERIDAYLCVGVGVGVGVVLALSIFLATLLLVWVG